MRHTNRDMIVKLYYNKLWKLQNSDFKFEVFCNRIRVDTRADTIEFAWTLELTTRSRHLCDDTKISRFSFLTCKFTHKDKLARFSVHAALFLSSGTWLAIAQFLCSIIFFEVLTSRVSRKWWGLKSHRFDLPT